MKKKLINKLIVTCLAFSSLFANTCIIPVHAETKTSEIETIAQNAPQFILGDDKKEWDNVTVENCKPLYDFNNKLIAYSCDLESNINNEKAFVIISTSEKDNPILEFGVKENSPYDKLDNDKTCIFDGVQGYYSHDTSNDKYYDLVDDKNLDNDEVKVHTNNSKNKQYVSQQANVAEENRLNLTQKKVKKNKKVSLTDSTFNNSAITSSNGLSGFIIDAPDYNWYHGCAPTSSAMVLKCLYKSQLRNIDQYKLTDELVNAMGTTLPDGGTSTSRIGPGIQRVMANHGVNVKTTLYSGKSNATYATAVSQINRNRPFVLSLIGSTETASGYPASRGGFGNHSMACIGYKQTSTNSYLCVHDTAGDGYVYCDYYSSALGYPYYTFVN